MALLWHGNVYILFQGLWGYVGSNWDVVLLMLGKAATTSALVKLHCMTCMDAELENFIQTYDDGCSGNGMVDVERTLLLV